jgi:putative transposase
MGEYRCGAHTVYEIHLHLVWTTKYRRPVLVGEPATRVRDLIREICGAHDVKIMKGHVSKDHVHLLVSIAPQVTISRLLQWLKGEDGAQGDDGIPEHQEALLGTTHVGAGLLLLQHRERHGRDDRRVHRTPER